MIKISCLVRKFSSGLWLFLAVRRCSLLAHPSSFFHFLKFQPKPGKKEENFNKRWGNNSRVCVKFFQHSLFSSSSSCSNFIVYLGVKGLTNKVLSFQWKEGMTELVTYSWLCNVMPLKHLLSMYSDTCRIKWDVE